MEVSCETVQQKEKSPENFVSELKSDDNTFTDSDDERTLSADSDQDSFNDFSDTSEDSERDVSFK